MQDKKRRREVLVSEVVSLGRGGGGPVHAQEPGTRKIVHPPFSLGIPQ